eukprot:Gb_27041 [translate_table: standard]
MVYKQRGNVTPPMSPKDSKSSEDSENFKGWYYDWLCSGNKGNTIQGDERQENASPPITFESGGDDEENDPNRDKKKKRPHDEEVPPIKGRRMFRNHDLLDSLSKAYPKVMNELEEFMKSKFSKYCEFPHKVNGEPYPRMVEINELRDSFSLKKEVNKEAWDRFSTIKHNLFGKKDTLEMLALENSIPSPWARRPIGLEGRSHDFTPV